MAKNVVNVYVSEQKLEKYKAYCEKTGRKLSNLANVAIEEYILRNPPK
jgi:hypothetical protein